MPRPTFASPKTYQPKNKPQGGGVPAWEGRPVDARFTMGALMQATVEAYADAEGLSQSAFVRNLIREGLAARGTVFPRYAYIND